MGGLRFCKMEGSRTSVFIVVLGINGLRPGCDIINIPFGQRRVQKSLHNLRGVMIKEAGSTLVSVQVKTMSSAAHIEYVVDITTSTMDRKSRSLQLLRRGCDGLV